jgi:hypothetical protein
MVSRGWLVGKNWTSLDNYMRDYSGSFERIDRPDACGVDEGTAQAAARSWKPGWQQERMENSLAVPAGELKVLHLMYMSAGAG